MVLYKWKYFLKEFRSKLNNNETLMKFMENDKLDIERVIDKYNNYIYTI